MEVERRLVLDANILIRAVLGRRVREIIAEHASAAAFFAPEVAFKDALQYLPARRGWELGGAYLGERLSPVPGARTPPDSVRP